MAELTPVILYDPELTIDGTTLKCLMSHIELTPDVTTVEITTSCGTTEYPGKIKWTRRRTSTTSFDPEGTSEVLTAAVAGRVPVPFTVLASAAAPVSATNPEFVGEVQPAIRAGSPATSAVRPEFDLEWSILGWTDVPVAEHRSRRRRHAGRDRRGRRRMTGEARASRWVGGEAAMADLRRWAAQLGPAIAKAGEPFGQRVADQVRGRVPVLSGQLAGSIESDTDDEGSRSRWATASPAPDGSSSVAAEAGRMCPRGRYLYPTALGGTRRVRTVRRQAAADTVGGSHGRHPQRDERRHAVYELPEAIEITSNEGAAHPSPGAARRSRPRPTHVRGDGRPERRRRRPHPGS